MRKVSECFILVTSLNAKTILLQAISNDVVGGVAAEASAHSWGIVLDMSTPTSVRKASLVASKQGSRGKRDCNVIFMPLAAGSFKQVSFFDQEFARPKLLSELSKFVAGVVMIQWQGVSKDVKLSLLSPTHV